MDTDAVLDLIKRYESGGRNIPNYMYSETPDESGLRHTAQGYYQITNENWNNYAPKVGIDLKKYQNAMAASEEDQRKVASYLLGKTPRGVRNWDANKPLMAELGRQGIMTSPDQEINSNTDLSNMSLEELQALKKKLENQVTPPPKDTGGRGGGVQQKTQGGAQQRLTVKPPEKGWFQKFAEEGEPSSTFAPSQAFGIVPGFRKMVRGATGYGLPPNASAAQRWAEGIEGFGTAALPIGVAAGTLATGGALGGALLAGEGLGGAALAGGGAALPYATGYLGSQLGSQLGEAVAPEFSSDPQVQRLIADIGGLGGGAVGGGVGKAGPKIIKSPVGRAAVAAGVGHTLGLPHWATGMLAGEEALGLRGILTDYLRSKVPGAGKSTPDLGKVKPPTIPATVEADAMLGTGSMTDDQYLAHMKSLGMQDDLAQAKLSHAKAKAAAKAKPQEPTITLTPEQMRGTTNPLGLQSVTLPPGVKINASPSPGPVPTGTGMPEPPVAPGSMGTVGPLGPMQPRPTGYIPTGTGMPQPPAPPIEPGSMGTVGPLPPSQPRPPLQGPPLTGTTELGPQPPRPAPAPPIPSPGLNLPVRPIGAPVPPQGPVPTRTPSGIMPPTEFERASQDIYRIARKLGQAPPITTNKLTLSRWQKLLGFMPTRDQMIEGRRIYHDWVRSGRPTATNPTGTETK